MSVDNPVAIPWYRSKIIVGAAISIIAKVLVMAGVINDLAPEDSENLANIIVLVAGGIGDLLAIGARITQKRAPDITVATTK
jgi:hypothetical protein